MARARPHGREALLLGARRGRRRSERLRVRERAARAGRMPRLPQPRVRDRACRGALGARRARRAHRVGRPACAGARALAAARPSVRAHRPHRVVQRAPGRGRGAPRGLPRGPRRDGARLRRPARLRGAPAARERRAGGRVPLRRDRQLAGGRVDAPLGRGPAADLHGGLRGPALRRAPARARRGGGARHRACRGDGGGLRAGDACRGHHRGVRPALRGLERAGDACGGAGGARHRGRGALGRGRRRALLRLRAPPARLRAGRLDPPRACVRAAALRRCRGAGGRRCVGARAPAARADPCRRRCGARSAEG